MDRVLTRTARWLAVGGVAAIVFGVILIFWPGISLVALTALFGAFALVSGTYAVGAGLVLLGRRSTEWVPFVIGGAAGILIGVVTFLHPGITLLTLTYLVAAWAFITGVFEILAAIDVWGEIPGAVWLAIGGAFSIVFGIIVAIQPGSGLLAIVWLVGVYAVMVGVARLIASYQLHQFHGEVRAAAGVMKPTHA